MIPERIARLVAWWVRLYTRNLPGPVAERRIGEIGADVHDHVAHERACGTGERRIALGLLSRMLRGLADDASWRGHVVARTSNPKDVMKPTRTTSRSALRILLPTALVLLIPLVLMQFDDGTNWSLFDFVFAGTLLVGTGVLLELAVRRPGNVVFRAAAVAIGVAAIALGEADDAPGLVGFGCLLILGAVALTVRTAQRGG